MRSSRSLAPRSPEVPRPFPPLRMAMSARVRLAGDEPFDAADDLELAFALAGLPGGVVPGGLVVSQADDGDAVQRHVALPGCRLVEPVPAGPAAGCGQRARAAEFGERGFAPDAFGVVAGDDGQGRGDDGPTQYMSSNGLACSSRIARMRSSKRPDCPFERLPCLGGGFQRDQRAMLDPGRRRACTRRVCSYGPRPSIPGTVP